MNCQEILEGIEKSGLVRAGHLQSQESRNARTVAQQVLDYNFKGFCVCAKRGAGFERLLLEFPWLKDIMALVQEKTTAVYVSPNIGEVGSYMKPHRDGCLPTRYVSGAQRRAPERITIAYVCTQDLTGGALVVDGNVIEIFEGMVVQFPGNLEHAVEPITFGRRVGVVLEEYELSTEELALIPDFDIP